MANRKPSDNAQSIVPDENDLDNAQVVLAALQRSFVEALVHQAGTKQWESILGPPALDAVRKALADTLKRPEMGVAINEAMETAFTQSFESQLAKQNVFLRDFESRISSIQRSAEDFGKEYSAQIERAVDSAIRNIAEGRQPSVGVPKPRPGVRSSYRHEPRGARRGIGSLFRSLRFSSSTLFGALIVLTFAIIGASGWGIYSTQQKMKELGEQLSRSTQISPAQTQQQSNEVANNDQNDSEPDQVNVTQESSEEDTATENVRFARPSSINGVNLRSSHSASAPIVGKISPSDTYRLIAAEKGPKYTWWKLVSLDGGVTGWAAADYLEECDPEGNPLSD